ncbi:MAG: hypothetical protein LAT82_04425 [Nanoarchaeota archaeon]|nr:hypothetical protein [Nanoarchaeota archaeon]
MRELRELERGLCLNTPSIDNNSWVPELYIVAQELLNQDKYGQKTFLGKTFPKYQTEIRRIPLGGSKVGIQIQTPNSYIQIDRTSRLVFDGRKHPEEVIYEVRHPENPQGLIKTLAEIIK